MKPYATDQSKNPPPKNSLDRLLRRFSRVAYGLAVLHHNPASGLWKSLMEVGPRRHDPEDVAKGGEAEQNQIHPSIVFASLEA